MPEPGHRSRLPGDETFADEHPQEVLRSATRATRLAAAIASAVLTRTFISAACS